MTKKSILSAIYFINQMPEAERGIVRRLVEDLESIRTAAETHVGIYEIKVESRIELEQFFNEVAKDGAHHHQGHVTFHIDAHSNETGVEVNGEMIPWNAFFTLLRPVNKALHGRLSLHLAACRAAWSLMTIDIDQSAPFMGVIAPTIDISAEDSIAIYRAYYATVLEKRDYRAAMLAMYHEAKKRDVKFHLTTAARMFCDSAAYFLEKANNAKGRQKRLEGMVSQMNQLGFNGIAFRKMLRAMTNSDPIPYLNNSWRRFTLLDIYPDLIDEVKAQMPLEMLKLLRE